MDSFKRQKLNEILSKKELYELAKLNRRTVSFSGQNKDELVFALFRQVAIRNIGWIIRGTILLLVPLFLPTIVQLLSQLNILKFSLTVAEYSILYIFYCTLVLSWMILQFSDWYLDVFIVSNERFIEIKFQPFTTVDVREIWLEDIEVIKSTTSGILGSLFKYGDLIITTRSDTGSTILKHIPNQEQKKNLLSDLAKIARKYRNIDV